MTQDHPEKIGIVAYFDKQIAALDKRAAEVGKDLAFVYEDGAAENRSAREIVVSLIEALEECEASLPSGALFGEACSMAKAALARAKGGAE